jgi:hypothetical protein
MGQKTLSQPVVNLVGEARKIKKNCVNQHVVKLDSDGRHGRCFTCGKGYHEKRILINHIIFANIMKVQYVEWSTMIFLSIFL